MSSEKKCIFSLQGLKKKNNKWYLDNGCSRHMIGNYTWFPSFTKIKNGGDISFGDNSKGKILGIGNVSKISSTLIENVCLVENLKHNLISISQLCDKSYKVTFDKTRCVIENACDNKFCLLEIDVVMFIPLTLSVLLLMINVFLHFMMMVGYGIED